MRLAGHWARIGRGLRRRESRCCHCDGWGADVALSITGFAEPGGEKAEEGLVHFAAAHANGELRHHEEHFGAVGCDPVRLAALEAALVMMKEMLDG